MDISVEFLFGTQLATLQKRLPIAGKAKLGLKGSKSDDAFGSFVQAFEAVQLRTVERINERWMWPLKELMRDHNQDAIAVVNAYVEPVIEMALADDVERCKRGEDLDLETATMLQYLVSKTYDKKTLRDQLVNFMVAGRDSVRGVAALRCNMT